MNTWRENIWYAIELTSNIKRNKIYPIEICGKKLILWKNKKGEYILQGGYCSHEGVLLYKGKIQNDAIVCPFHGYKFDCKGHCDRKIPHIRNYQVISYLGIIWFYNGTGEAKYHPQDHVKNIVGNQNINDFYTLDVFDETYPLPTKLLISNFYDIGHFKYFHGVDIQKTEVLQNDSCYKFQAGGYYKHFRLFQRILFKLIPNKVENIIAYSKSFTVSHHMLLTKSGKIIVDYYGIYPSSPINEEKTRIVSTILIKKGFFGWFAHILSKFLLSKAGNGEYGMLLGGNYKISNLTDEDEILKGFLNYYEHEHSTL